MLKVGSLFSGIGGIELGLERTRYFETKWFVENDGFCRKTLARHWPGIPIHGDITTLDFQKLPRVDVLSGGFPCQDISYAGKGKGIREGTRSGLWFYFAKAIGILRPRYALIENVPALANRGLDVVLADLAEAGYDAEWFDLRASDFGALHRRERIFIVAYRDCRGRWKDGKFGNGGELGKGGENPDLSSTPENQTAVAHNNSNADSRRHVHGKSAESTGEGREQAQRESTPRVVAVPVSDGRRKDAVKQPLPLVEIRGKIQQGGQTEFIIAHDCLSRVHGFREKKIQAKQGFSWCQDVRRIEDLSGRPDIPEPLFRGARDGVPDWVDRVKSLGNAVVPDCAEFIGELIMEHHKKEGRTEGT